MQLQTIETSPAPSAIHAARSPAAPVRFVTIAQAAKLRPAFSPAAFRDLRFKAFDRKNSRGETIKGNGTGPAGVWVQVGSKVLVDLEAFDAWLESHRVTGGRA